MWSSVLETAILNTIRFHSILMPATLLVGAALALVCNLIARMPGFEGALPVNSVTALVGAPVVASVLFRKRKGELNE